MLKITEELKKTGVLICDGAWGTMLQKSGLTQNEAPEYWNLSKKEELKRIALEYVNSGARLLETNTFGANRIKLEHYGLGERTREINMSGAELLRDLKLKEVIILGSVGPSGKFLITGDIQYDDLFNVYGEQVKSLEEGGVNAFILETYYDIDEAECAINAVRDNSDLELIVSFTYDKKNDNSFRTMMGNSPVKVAEFLISKGVDIIGTNCGNGFNDMIEIVKEYRKVDKKIPILVNSNAGLPKFINGELVYSEDPEFAAHAAERLYEEGASIIGGCCGTTPLHIKAISERLKLKYGQ